MASDSLAHLEVVGAVLLLRHPAVDRLHPLLKVVTSTRSDLTVIELLLNHSSDLLKKIDMQP
jgi:hypothetical protein